jgi:hypothetical protein
MPVSIEDDCSVGLMQDPTNVGFGADAFSGVIGFFGSCWLSESSIRRFWLLLGLQFALDRDAPEVCALLAPEPRIILPQNFWRVQFDFQQDGGPMPGSQSIPHV